MGLVAITATPSAGADPFVRGDANGDGLVDLSDAIATLMCLFDVGDEYDEHAKSVVSACLEELAWWLDLQRVPKAEYRDYMYVR